MLDHSSPAAAAPQTAVTRRCVTCKQSTERRALEPTTGTEKQLTVRLQQLPVLVCGQGHKQFTTPDFAIQLLEHLTEEDEAALPAGQVKGVAMFRKYLCRDCGEPLPAAADGEETFVIQVSLTGEPTFQVQLTAPVHRCTGCGLRQLHSLKETRGWTPAALAAAFRSAGIAHG